MKRRSSQPSIDLLLRENKILSMTLYVVAVLSVLCGIVMLVFGVWRNQPIIALAGAVETYLFIPAWRSVQELRREKKLIRLARNPAQPCAHSLRGRGYTSEPT